MTSKLNGELVAKAVEDILAYSAGETIKKGDAEVVGKKRKFTESIELQVLRADLPCAHFYGVRPHEHAFPSWPPEVASITRLYLSNFRF